LPEASQIQSASETDMLAEVHLGFEVDPNLPVHRREVSERIHSNDGNCQPLKGARPMESTAYRDLAIQHADAVYCMAFLLARNSADASHLVLETYRCASIAQRSFVPRDRDARLWLLSILHKVLDTTMTCRNERQSDALEPLELQADDAVTDILGLPCWNPATVDWEQVHDRLEYTIAELSTGDRDALHLWAVENLRYREIAEVLDVPMKTAVHRLPRVRSMLFRHLANLTGDHMDELHSHSIVAH